ncbi:MULTISPECIES: DUF7619 domain-containing protein [Flavobacterium]|uniref:T9SS type A sorting domain-containing protein n=1 Tax=Flavobacterium hankyongi TaxID=1176532 RepID=A0ABP8ZJN1_9FLAO|nr:T9SS type A sorting domain-containing protein [Flavobacterium sp. N1846]
MRKLYFLLTALCLFTSVNAQIINFPDANFKAKLLAASPSNTIAQNLSGSDFKIDANSNGQIEISEALQVKKLSLAGGFLPITDLTGILYFSNIEVLNCGHLQLTSLNLNGLVKLKYLECFYNNLTSLDLSGVPNLVNLKCSSNSLLSSLNVAGLINLKTLDCSFGNLTSLNLSGLINLISLDCQQNEINQLSVIGLSNLVDVNCSMNNLSSLFIKNGNPSAWNSLYFSSNPNLRYICADDEDIVLVQNNISQWGLTNCHVNTYCSFTPEGTYYTIQGNNKFDVNNNGCDASDISLPNLKFSIINGSNTGSLIANTSGNYYILVQAGTHTVIPVFENPSYFTVSPASVNVTFPTQASPFTQNFCVTANGVHPDLEIIILPVNVARPGFDAKYKLIYKNKGNITQSGTVNLAFNDAVLDFVSANPVVTTQTINNLFWNFTNLLPFETREITFTLNVNSPMETPAVNSGDVLNYAATVTSPTTDDLPNDNTFVFNQTVVNSFDPNDKTCLEGATISPSKVGDYVNYMIRFENNGTANAQNIVVKDMIDTTKFDINSLVPIKGSHSFVTNITSGNKVEFIFENINLPFNDANNDGYVSFKIKTKPTLTNGDTFSNTASIYFDYNFPIVTNTATTTIQALSRQDFDFSSYFKLYPNPVSNNLNIEAKDTIEISSISIYNTLGQLVLVVPNAQNIKTVDVSNLSSGNYFIKINSDKGTSNTKFIKN